jgi:UDP-N-acetylglucosamine 1-carboxyvinyltransferase
MKKLLINGGIPLHGDIVISGAKNAALPLMVSSILCSQKLTLVNIPQVSDIATMANLLTNLGINICLDGYDKDMGNQGKVMVLDASNLNNPIADYDLVRKMRASIFVLGPLLARCGRAKVSLPGGCAIGTRPVDLHLKALQALGASFELKDGYVEGFVKNQKLRGAEIYFEKVSVGATENAMMASCLAVGETVINNAACEPEILDLANCLIGMGAKIFGAGSSKIIIQGVDELNSYRHRIIPDRIEVGTYAIASAITNGKIRLHGINSSILNGFKNELELAGVMFKEISNDIVEVSNSSQKINPVNISTHPYPGFPTDLQAQFMALMTLSNGVATIEENIFENRFMHVLELVRMNANIESHGKIAIIKGVEKLKGAEVMATDLRASVSLVLAGLVAEGQTTINRLYHLERGYERLAEKLINCGADIKIIY